MERLAVEYCRELNAGYVQFRELALESGLVITMIKEGDERLLPVYDSKLKPLASHVGKYLKSPTITFLDKVEHSARRVFSARLQIENFELYTWYESNRLRYNNMLGLTYLPIIHRKLLSTMTNAETLLKLVSKMVPDTAGIYDGLSIPQRVETSVKLSQVLRKVYTEILKVDPTSAYTNN